MLHGLLIEPLLGIADPRRDTRIDCVGGIRGLGELERRVDSGEMAVSFSLYPTSLEALMAVADPSYCLGNVSEFVQQVRFLYPILSTMAPMRLTKTCHAITDLPGLTVKHLLS